MRNGPLTCEQVRSRLAACLDAAGESAEVAAHLAGCDACLDLWLDSALAAPADVPVPDGFAQRTLARARGEESEGFSAVPYAMAAACLVFILTAAWVISSGTLEQAAGSLVTNKTLLGCAAVCEIAGSFAWAWRAARD